MYNQTSIFFFWPKLDPRRVYDCIGIFKFSMKRRETDYIMILTPERFGIVGMVYAIGDLSLFIQSSQGIVAQRNKDWVGYKPVY